jgi:endonuclease/exonuclease/phosphatase family metal-dependent hydrolase
MMKLLLVLLFALLPHIDTSLLESGKGATIRQQTASPTEIKVLSYNIRWRGGDDLKTLIKLLQEDPEIGCASILALQEVDRHKKRTGTNNTSTIIANALGMYYAWAAPPPPKPNDEEETGVAILSIYPLSDVRRIVLPHPGPGQRRRVALGATIEIPNHHWRVYSAHAETRIKIGKKLEQYQAVLDDLAQFPAGMPAIVMGDFNTWEPNLDGKVTKLFSNAGLKTPFGDNSTFRRKVLFVPIELKLDWVWLRGLEAATFGIDRKVEVSDHWPLWTNVKIGSQKGIKEIQPQKSTQNTKN